MSWYFLGGFSAYLSVPSGRRLNHSGCSFNHGWSGEHWIAKSSAISIPCSFASATSASKSSIVPRSGCTASWPPCSEPIAHGEPTSPFAATSALFFPLRFVCPIGGIGGRETTSKTSSASSGRTRRTPLNPPQERGKSSYQEPKRAIVRSTSTAYVADHVFACRSWFVAASASSTVSSSAPSSCAPSDSSLLTSSWPASTLRRSSSWNESTRSTHASIR